MSLARFFQDPVTSKELSGLARRWQTYAARGLYVGLFGILVWNLSSRLRMSLDDWYSPSGLADLGIRFLQSFLPFQTALIILSAISSASDLVTKEIRMGTLGVLACTPLSSWRVALGKWKAATAQGLTLLLCGAPILGVCVSLGAAPPEEILGVLALSAAAAALGAALSLFCSSLSRSGTTALLLATLLFGAYLILPVVLLDFPSDRSVGFTMLSHGHLLFALAASMRHPPIPELEGSWRSAAALTGALALLLVRLTAGRLERLTLRAPAPPLLTRVFEGLDRFYEGIGPERLRRWRFFEDGDGVWQRGAILWKELRTRASGRLRNSVRIAVVLLLILAFSLLLDFRYLWIPSIGTTVLIWYMALANGASLFVKEKEERKWDLLLATPLGSGQILAAKLLAGIVPLVPLAAAFLFFWIALVVTGILQVGEVLVAWTAIATPTMLAYLLGAACSLKAQSLRGAFTLALFLLLGMVLLVPWLISEWGESQGVFGSRVRDAEVDHYWLDPSKILYSVSSREPSWSFWRSLGERSAGSLSLLVVYLPLSGGLLAYMALRFNSITGRSG